MKKMKLLSLLLAFVLAIACISGCSSDNSDSKPADTKTQEDDIDTISGDVNDNSNKKTETEVKEVEVDPSSINMKLGKTYTVSDVMELTLNETEWVEQLDPSNTSSYYSYYEDKDGEKYFVIRGTMKNLAGEAFDPEYISDVKFKINGKYEFEGRIEAEDSDGTDFYGKPTPLQTVNVVVYASISDAAYESCKSVHLEMKLLNDSSKVSEFFYEDETPHDIYVMDLKME